MELMKLLAAPRAAETLAVMADAGILQNLLGGVACVASFARNGGERKQRSGAARPGARARGARCGRRSRMPNGSRQRLRLDECGTRAPAVDGGWLVAYRSRRGTTRREGSALPAWARRISSIALLLAWARSGDAGERRCALAHSCDLAGSAGRRRCFRSRPLISWRAESRKAPLLGEVLRAAEEAWIAADFPAEWRELQEIADRAARQRLSRSHTRAYPRIHQCPSKVVCTRVASSAWASSQ